MDEDDVTKRDTIDSLGRKQLTSFINESGLYVATDLRRTMAEADEKNTEIKQLKMQSSSSK